MQFLLNLLVVVQILSAFAMIGLILVQHGKGADMGAAFGSGASGSLFGASGSANFLSRSTAVLATVFLSSTLVLAYFGNLRNTDGADNSVLGNLAATPPLVAASAAASAPSSAPQAPAASLVPTGMAGTQATPGAAPAASR